MAGFFLFMHTGVQRKDVSRLTDARCASWESLSQPDRRRGRPEEKCQQADGRLVRGQGTLFPAR